MLKVGKKRKGRQEDEVGDMGREGMTVKKKRKLQEEEKGR